MEESREIEAASDWIPSFAIGLSILVVDHDASSLITISSLLQQSYYNVTTSQAASSALSMVEDQKDRFKLVMANADMPDMDYLPFLHKLLEKNIPVILMSSERSVSAAIKAIVEGASFFFNKPISLDDLKYLWQHVYRKKRSCSFISTRKNAPADDTKTKDKQIELVMKWPNENKKSRKKGKRLETMEEEEENKQISLKKKPRILWTPELHLKFTAAISILGDEKARPKPILEIMNVPNLTQRQVASHLQKYKSQVQRICQTGTSNKPAASRSSNFYGRRSFDTLVKKTTPPIFYQRRPYSDFKKMGDMIQMLPSGSCPPDISSSYTSQNKNKFLWTSDGTTQELDSLAGLFSSGNSEQNSVHFPTNFTDGSQINMDFMQVSETAKFLDEFNDSDEEIDVMAFLNPPGEIPNLENILTASSDWNSEQDVAYPAQRNMSQADADKQKLDATVVSGSASCSIDQSQHLPDPADLFKILDEEPAGFKDLASDHEPNSGDVDKYCEWLTNILHGDADNIHDAAEFNYGIEGFGDEDMA